MSARRLALGRPALASVVLAVLLAAPLAADYRQRYLEGLAALRRGAYEEAANHLAAAAGERPEEQARARLVGAIPEPYLPHLYLGLAHYGRRDCTQAETAWARSAAQGVAATVAAAARAVAEPRRHCALLTEATAALADAEADARRLSGGDVPADGPRQGSAEAGGSSGEAAARRALAGVRERLATAQREWSLESATQAVHAARAAAALLADQARQALDAAPTESAAPAGRDHAVSTVMQVADDALIAAGSSTTSTTPGGAGPGPTATVPSGPPATVATTAGPAASATSSLLTAATAFLGGDYAGVLGLLSADEPAGTPGERLAAHLLRAAAAHALYQLGGERDPALLATAHTAIAAVRALDPAYRPDADAFSPRFRALFANL